MALFGGMGRMGEGDTAVDQAQEVIYSAWEAPTRRRRVALARKALTISPDCADAYLILASDAAKTIDEEIDFYRKGVEAGERALGREAFEDAAGYFWGILETRPYMRSRAGLARALWLIGESEEALQHYREMLRLNPDDNQGIRDVLLPGLIALGRDEEAEELFKAYEESGTAMWVYSRALLDFRKQGASRAADRSLAAALDENEHVPAYLLGRKKMPPALPGYYGIGDDNEAVIYVHESMAAWRSTPGATEWLAAKAG